MRGSTGLWTAAMLLLVVGCGGGGGSSSSPPLGAAPPPPPTGGGGGSDSPPPDNGGGGVTTLSGTAVKGLLANADITVTSGSFTSQGATGTDGRFSIEVPSSPSRPVVVTVTSRDDGSTRMRCDVPDGCGASSGDMDSNANGEADYGEWFAAPAGLRMRAGLAQADIDRGNATVSALSDLALAMAGDSPDLAAVTGARRRLRAALSLPTDPVATTPADPMAPDDASEAALELGLVLTGIAALAFENGQAAAPATLDALLGSVRNGGLPFHSGGSSDLSIERLHSAVSQSTLAITRMTDDRNTRARLNTVSRKHQAIAAFAPDRPDGRIADGRNAVPDDGFVVDVGHPRVVIKNTDINLFGVVRSGPQPVKSGDWFERQADGSLLPVASGFAPQRPGYNEYVLRLRLADDSFIYRSLDVYVAPNGQAVVPEALYPLAFHSLGESAPTPSIATLFGQINFTGPFGGAPPEAIYLPALAGPLDEHNVLVLDISATADLDLLTTAGPALEAWVASGGVLVLSTGQALPADIIAGVPAPGTAANETTLHSFDLLGDDTAIRGGLGPQDVVARIPRAKLPAHIIPLTSTGPDGAVVEYRYPLGNGFVYVSPFRAFGTTDGTTVEDNHRHLRRFATTIQYDADADAVPTSIEYVLGTDPFDMDTDDDGLSDALELRYGLDPNTPDADADFDGDSLDNLADILADGDPAAPDTDGDGLEDAREVAFGSDLRNVDSDNDGLLDGDEANKGTSPVDRDTDDDGLNDRDEGLAGTHPLVADTDGDGFLDGDEITVGLLPTRPDPDNDFDGDGLLVSEEILLGTKATLADTDRDGLEDGAEARIHGTDPLASDTDLDGLSDGDEVNIHGSDPHVVDTDGGGQQDKAEVVAGTDPTDPQDDRNGSLRGTVLTSGTGEAWPFDSGLRSLYWSLRDVRTHLVSEDRPGPSLNVLKRVIIGDNAGFVLQPVRDRQSGVEISYEAFAGSGPWVIEAISLVNGGTSNQVIDLKARYTSAEIVAPPHQPAPWLLVGQPAPLADSSAVVLAGRHLPLPDFDGPDDVDRVMHTYRMELAPGERGTIVRFTTFPAQRHSTEALAAQLASDPPLDQLDPAWRNSVVNFDVGAGDTDGDGMTNRIEAAYGLAPGSAADRTGDPDGDGIGNADEVAGNSHPRLVDTDGDGLIDAAELDAGTAPARADTDGDGISDADEAASGTDARIADTDSDGSPDGEELAHGTDPLNPVDGLRSVLFLRSQILLGIGPSIERFIPIAFDREYNEFEQYFRTDEGQTRMSFEAGGIGLSTISVPPPAPRLPLGEVLDESRVGGKINDTSCQDARVVIHALRLSVPRQQDDTLAADFSMVCQGETVEGAIRLRSDVPIAGGGL